MNMKNWFATSPPNVDASPSDALAKRVRKFQNGFARRHREQYHDLVRHGQKPTRLFISCADSRIIPDALTGSKPGENFSVRVVGNIVPPYDLQRPDAAVGSAIEYSIKVLGIEEVIVCGHSHCGACAALMTGQGKHLTLAHRWLEHGLPVRRAIESQIESGGRSLSQLLSNHASRDEVFRAAERAMVVQQVRNLRSYPFVDELVASGDLRLRGWYYEIESGQVDQYDGRSLSFVPVAEAPTARAARHDQSAVTVVQEHGQAEASRPKSDPVVTATKLVRAS